MVREGLIERRSNTRGKLGNYALTHPRSSNTPHAAAPPLRATAATPIPTDWYWEGSVVDRLAAHLENEGWAIIQRANSATRERGIDLHVERAEETLLVEAKGYPSTEYRDPARAGQRKPTNPSVQAQHWFAQGLLKALRLQSQHPGATVALAFPDFPRYRALAADTEGALSKLGVRIFFIGESGNVELLPA